MMYSIPMPAPSVSSRRLKVLSDGPGLEGGWHVWMFLPGRHAAAALPQSRQVFSR